MREVATREASVDLPAFSPKNDTPATNKSFGQVSFQHRTDVVENKLAQMFVVLAIAGTVCMLASLGAVTYLYHQHAPQLALQSYSEFPPAAQFGVFVALPALACFLGGAWMTWTGVKIGLKE